MPVQIVLDATAPGKTETHVFARCKHNAGIHAPSYIRSLDLGCRLRTPNSVSQFHAAVLRGNTDTDRERVIDLKSQARVHVDGLNLGKNTAIARIERILVLGLHAEGNGNAQAGPKGIG